MFKDASLLSMQVQIQSESSLERRGIEKQVCYEHCLLSAFPIYLEVTSKQGLHYKFRMYACPFLELFCWVATDHTHWLNIFDYNASTAYDSTLANLPA